MNPDQQPIDREIDRLTLFDPPPDTPEESTLLSFFTRREAAEVDIQTRFPLTAADAERTLEYDHQKVGSTETPALFSSPLKNTKATASSNPPQKQSSGFFSRLFGMDFLASNAQQSAGDDSTLSPYSAARAKTSSSISTATSPSLAIQSSVPHPMYAFPVATTSPETTHNDDGFSSKADTVSSSGVRPSLPRPIVPPSQSVTSPSVTITFESTDCDIAQNHPPMPGSIQTIMGRIKELTTKGDIGKEYWMPDESCTICYSCESPFNLFRRKHHCRLCGQIFCSKCIVEISTHIENKIHQPSGANRHQIICVICQNQFEQYKTDAQQENAQTLSKAPQMIEDALQTMGSWFDISKGKESKDENDASAVVVIEESDVVIVDHIVDVEEEDVVLDGNQDEMDEDFEGIFVYESSSGESASEGEEGIDRDNDDREGTKEAEEKEKAGQEKDAESPEKTPLRKFSFGKSSSAVGASDFSTPPSSGKRRSAYIPNQSNADSRLSRTLSLRFDQNFMRSLLEVEGILNCETSSPPEIGTVPVSQKIARHYEVHTRHIIAQLVAYYGLDSEWTDKIISLARLAIDDLKSFRDAGSIQNLKELIKIKRMPGGQIQDSISGEGFIFGKHIAHKKMNTIIENPKIILLHNGLEYQRVENKLCSLHPIVQQEREHLRILVNKVIAASPDLIVVEKAVSGIAIELLLQANVTVILNTKETVINRLGSYLNIPAYQSVELINEKAAATCLQFRNESYRADDGSKRTISLFQGSKTQPGAYIILRGGDMQTLSKVKSVLKFCIMVVQNSIFEAAFVHDSGCGFHPSGLASITESEAEEDTDTAQDSKMYHSISPGIEFPVPVRGQSRMEVFTQEILNPVLAQMTPEERAAATTFQMNHQQIIGDDVDSNEGGHGLGGGQDISCATLMPDTVLFNQQISFLSSCCTAQTGAVCEEPSIVGVDYYEDSDLTLGEFLERSCFDIDRPCRRHNCKEKVYSHIRSFIHHKVCVNVGVESFVSNDLFDGIHIRSFCRLCQYTANWTPLSNEAWKLSFGKFLELCFYSKGLYNRNSGCEHNFFRNFNIYFRHSNMIAVFHCEDITLLDICIPDTYLTYDQESLSGVQEMQIAQVSDIIDRVYEEILSKLCYLENYVLHGEQLKNIQELKKSHRQEHAAFFRQLAKYKEFNDIFQVNKVKRSLLANIKTWNSTFHELLLKFARKRNHHHHAAVLDEIQLDEASLVPILSVSPEDSEPIIMPLIDPESANIAAMTFDHPSVALSSSPGYYSYWNHFGSAPTNRIVDEPAVILGSSPTISSLSLLSPATTSSVPESQTKQSERNRLSTDSSSDVVSVASQNKGAAKTAQKSAPFYEKVSTVRTVISSLGKSFDPNIVLQDGEIGHVLLPPGTDDVVVEVFEDEPGSMIAYTLRSHEYRDKMAAFGCDVWNNISDQSREDIDEVTMNPNYPQFRALDGALLDKTATHIRHKFTDETNGGKIQFTCTAYYAKQFHALRQLHCGGDYRFVHSISRCKKWGATGGKSGSSFCKTLDDRFVLKQVSKIELSHFLEFAPQYFEYMYLTHFKKLPSALVKILGIYRVGHRQNIPGAPYHVQDFIVLENLFYGRKLKNIYDLKGSKRSRYVQAKGKDSVLMDENLIEFIAMSPLYTVESSKVNLNKCIHNDTMFLTQQNVVDYSLLAGIDEENGQLVVGIIDYMRRYTWDKKLETWVKSTGIIGPKTTAAPTVISPVQYKTRFRVAMDAYFLIVPDKWSHRTTVDESG